MFSIRVCKVGHSSVMYGDTLEVTKSDGSRGFIVLNFHRCIVLTVILWLIVLNRTMCHAGVFGDVMIPFY